MKEGDIIIAVFPQSDGSLKCRPALILREMPPFRDFSICGISTQLRQKVENFDEVILSGDDDFQRSNLDSESIIRLGFLLFAAQSDYRLNRRYLRCATSKIVAKLERTFN